MRGVIESPGGLITFEADGERGLSARLAQPWEAGIGMRYGITRGPRQRGIRLRRDPFRAKRRCLQLISREH